MRKVKVSTRSLDIVAAMNHPGMFAPWFPGTTWDNWRVILKAAFALPMTEDERAFLRTVAEREPPMKPVRELWCVAGRRGGKDSVASLIVAFSAALFDGQDKLRQGERATCMCLAVDREQAAIVLNYVRSYFTTIPPFAAMVTRATANGFELSNGVDVVVATNSFRSIRGRTILCSVLDETAFWMDENTAKPDVATYAALVPGMATLPSAVLVGISTPHKKAGLLYNKWKAHFGKPDDRVLVVQAASTTLNPTLDPAIIAQAMEDDPAAASAEWMGLWRDDIGGYVTLELIEAAVDRGVVTRPPLQHCRHFGFVDAASGTGRDSFAVAIAHAEGTEVVLDVAHEIRPPFSPTTAIEEVADLLKNYGIQTVNGDKYAAGFVVDGFARCGIKYEYAEHDRSEIYLECLPLLTSGRARLLDVKRLLHQFATLERRTMSTGRDVVDHGRGDRQHDDLCNAAAGAMAAAGAGHVSICDLITPDMVSRIRMAGAAQRMGLPGPFSVGERAMAQMRRARGF